MFRSTVIPAFAIAVLALVSAPAASAQMKVGVINFQRAMSETAEIKKAQADLEKKFKPRQDALDKLQRELSDIQTQLQASAGKLSAAGEADLNAQASRKQRDAQRLSEDLQGDVEAERNTVLQTARRIAMKDGRVYGTITGVGIKHLADEEIPDGKAHRRRAVAAAAGLVEQDRAVLAAQARDQVEGRRGCGDAAWGSGHAGVLGWGTRVCAWK